jgi:type II secretory pathway pseudopilin PulG
MKLRGQQRGYAMVVLLVSLSIMAIMMTAVMPVWRQAAQREKEAELVFRGEQYARAISLLQRKTVGALPPSFDFLVEQRFLRKKFKDPITNDDFVPILLSASAPPGAAAPGPQRGSPPGFGRGAQAGAAPTTGGITPGAPTAAGITGVTSKSKEASIRLYRGRNHYNEWLFVFTPPAAPPGAGGPPGSSAPGIGGPRGRPPGSSAQPDRTGARRTTSFSAPRAITARGESPAAFGVPSAAGAAPDKTFEITCRLSIISFQLKRSC